MQKPRPAVVLSPDEMNSRLNTVIVGPLTSRGFSAPFRVSCQFNGVPGQIALDHLRSLDKLRLSKKLGNLEPSTAASTLSILREIFAR